MSQKSQLWHSGIAIASSFLMLVASATAAIAESTSRVENLPITPELPPLDNAEAFLPQALQTRLVLRLSDRRVYYYQGDEAIASYPVAIGRKGWETPTGTFNVLQKVQFPTWQHPFTQEIVPPGPDNPLGDRWIGFWTDGDNYIGFHGTPNEELIGQAVSHGCVRMRNADIIALYEKIHMGTPVVVEP
ncbi:MAG: L,D-transpeptidase [Cyanobacteriota bacterium]|nr:L,D-transpeptidase [Cyanobacteriota bacterium]